MKTRSLSTQASDPYRGGLELAEGLAALRPEIVFVFSTVHYGQSPELLEGLADGLQCPDVILVGTTGDGFYHQSDCGDIGCVALGINSEGLIDWQWTAVEGVHDHPDGCLLQAWEEIQQKNGSDQADLLFMFADFRADASRFEKVLQEHIPVPVVGGIAADDNQMKDCALYAGRRCLRDALVLVSARGAFEYAIHLGNSISAVGKPGRVEATEGTNILRIDGLSAMDFIERETGKPVLRSDRGVTSLSILDTDDRRIRRLRAIVPDFSRSERSVGLYGGIEEGERVQVCTADPEQLLAEVQAIARACRSEAFKPDAALIVSCAGRKGVLGEQINAEIRTLVGDGWEALPVAGFPSFGEIAPVPLKPGYSQNLFHNMTYVVLLLGGP